MSRAARTRHGASVRRRESEDCCGEMPCRTGTQSSCCGHKAWQGHPFTSLVRFVRGLARCLQECKDGSAVKVLVGLASNLDVVFDNLKVAWTVQGMVYIMYLAVFNPGTMVGTAVLAAIVLIERVVMMLWPRCRPRLAPP